MLPTNEACKYGALINSIQNASMNFLKGQNSLTFDQAQQFLICMHENGVFDKQKYLHKIQCPALGNSKFCNIENADQYNDEINFLTKMENSLSDIKKRIRDRIEKLKRK
jgi:chromosome segregation ATPase